MAKSKNFTFDGGAGTYVGASILRFLIAICTFGIAFPYELVLKQRWIVKHTYVKGFLFCVVTLGIYGFRVAPRLQKWVVEHTDFSPLL